MTQNTNIISSLWLTYQRTKKVEWARSWRYKKKGEYVLKKATAVPSARRLSFGDKSGILLIYYLQKRKTITEDCYARLLNKLKTKIALQLLPWLTFTNCILNWSVLHRILHYLATSDFSCFLTLNFAWRIDFHLSRKW